jgi:hypothetical protein
MRFICSQMGDPWGVGICGAMQARGKHIARVQVNGPTRAPENSAIWAPRLQFIAAVATTFL